MASKDERIAKIYEILSQNSQNITELANKLNVSTKTIERDLKSPLLLSELQRKGQSWSIKPVSQNSFVINMLKKLSLALGLDFYKRANKFLRANSSYLSDLTLFTDINSEKLESRNIDDILLLQSAINQKLQVKLNYKDKFRTINPLKIALFDGFWYLVCQEDSILKTFYLKELENIELLNTHFKLCIDVSNVLSNANSIWFSNAESFSVKLLINPQIAKYFIRKPLKTQRIIEKCKDGSLVIEIYANDKMQVKPIIYEYLPHITLLEPLWLANDIKQELQNYMQKLET
ncbi:MAG: WYL domain-containing protein, partial [Campylobacter sp.]|jgi:predicted DNA-binding transcriptional regulator YafY|nr:WYL domain-containing protein [Campylobacter sp.]MBR2164530.1 WYL domain-containing protein [Campylobacter sp.]MBR6612465.1 WYL domain-containing protein [Campylobacter sp.]